MCGEQDNSLVAEPLAKLSPRALRGAGAARSPAPDGRAIGQAFGVSWKTASGPAEGGQLLLQDSTGLSATASRSLGADERDVVLSTRMSAGDPITSGMSNNSITETNRWTVTLSSAGASSDR